MVARRESISPPVHGTPGRDARHRRRNRPAGRQPLPAEAFHRGDYHRLRAGHYRIVYMTEDDLVTIEHVDRAA